MSERWDETWHRLREWTNGQGPSERLAAQILLEEGFTGLDPSHPLGGKDGGKDALCYRTDRPWIMAVYFPRGQKSFPKIKKKFENDLNAARSLNADGIAFVTNQELTLRQRKTLIDSATGILSELYHLERITAILDSPRNASVRKQFLEIDAIEAMEITARNERQIQLLEAPSGTAFNIHFILSASGAPSKLRILQFGSFTFASPEGHTVQMKLWSFLEEYGTGQRNKSRAVPFPIRGGETQSITVGYQSSDFESWLKGEYNFASRYLNSMD